MTPDSLQHDTNMMYLYILVGTDNRMFIRCGEMVIFPLSLIFNL